ncbi:uncharacterized protein LOC112605256 [Theropithecus gelada]|uniref:uncharacterized protein LOC112605256 n=1 Tax=Theropithecus gelada TaxID=9565 RepID=UPI000DC1962D|nr:uncharacterized protein LOC112605256 [Theropithecus gelada]
MDFCKPSTFVGQEWGPQREYPSCRSCRPCGSTATTRPWNDTELCTVVFMVMTTVSVSRLAALAGGTGCSDFLAPEHSLLNSDTREGQGGCTRLSPSPDGDLATLISPYSQRPVWGWRELGFPVARSVAESRVFHWEKENSSKEKDEASSRGPGRTDPHGADEAERQEACTFSLKTDTGQPALRRRRGHQITP